MTKPTAQQIRYAAETAGIDICEAELESVAARLGLLLAELDRVSDEDLEGIEPAPTFFPAGGPSGE